MLFRSVQKSVELGARGIFIFPAERCVSRPSAPDGGKKSERLFKIAEEAAKQCGRGRIPEVVSTGSYREAVENAAKAEMPLFFYEDEKTVGFKDALLSGGGFKTASVVIGPEGGFEPWEVEMARDCGMVVASLGARILRCETAPICALSGIMFHTGNL